jgi:3-oxoacyl-[acyl-carrier-protein] synthase-3
MHTIQMNGREVFRFATRVMASATREAVHAAGLQLDEIHQVIPHQANRRIIEAASRSLRLPLDRFYMNLDRYGNTSTASIPIAACEALEAGRIRPGYNIVLVAFGAGLTWGALALEWVAQERELPAGRRWRRRALLAIAKIRSFWRRILRRLEGLIWGTSTSGDE